MRRRLLQSRERTRGVDGIEYSVHMNPGKERMESPNTQRDQKCTRPAPPTLCPSYIVAANNDKCAKGQDRTLRNVNI